MSLKWPESVMLKFLQLYHKNDCLWNHRLNKYTNKDARENALSSIVKEMGIAGLTIADMKNKIKTIRTMYKKELSLVCKSQASGKLYVPKLFWYRRADLFLNAVTRNNTSSNINLSHHRVARSCRTIKKETENQDENEFAPSTSASVNTGNGDNQEGVVHVEIIDSANPSAPKHSKTTNVFRAPQSLKRKTTTNDNISATSAAIDKLDKVAQNSKNEGDDEFDIFAKYVAVQLKQMPLYHAIICEDQIQTLIRQKRLELLSRQSQYHTTQSPAFSPSGHTTPSPDLSTGMDGQWSSSDSNDS